MRCGLSPIVAMRKTKGLFIVGNKKGFVIYWEFLPFFSVLPGKVNRFTANPRHFPRSYSCSYQTLPGISGDFGENMQ